MISFDFIRTKAFFLILMYYNYSISKYFESILFLSSFLAKFSFNVIISETVMQACKIGDGFEDNDESFFKIS